MNFSLVLIKITILSFGVSLIIFVDRLTYRRLLSPTAATGMKWIEVKMRELGVTNNPNYKIAFFLDSSAMISVSTQKYGLVNVSGLHIVIATTITTFAFLSI